MNSEANSPDMEEGNEQATSTSPRSATSCETINPHQPSPLSRFEHYDLKVDHIANDRATEIKLCSLQRPHMRSLHCAWFSFFLAFMLWFVVAPLLTEIGDTLNLTTQDLWSSSIASDSTAILMRLIAGPMCDYYGARIPMAAFLGLASIPTFFVGLVNSSAGLIVNRFFIGIAGTTFVMAMCWTTRMFTKETTGRANGLVAGWGNAGGAFAQVFMGSLLFPAFVNKYNGDREKAWRIICVIPASFAMAWSFVVCFIADDAPMGYYKEMKKNGTMDLSYYEVSFIRSGWTDKNTWLLGLQYACCFGVELVMNNGLSLYFKQEFNQSTESAAALASLFGWMNLFARAAGGRMSDYLNLQYGMRGRLWLQSSCLLLEGSLIVVFAYMDTLAGAIVVMCIFSIFVQAAEGAIYGVVPYVSTKVTGAAAGIVGAGGNVGGMGFGFGFRQLSYKNAFLVMGSVVMSSSFLSLGVKINGHAGLVTGQDSEVVIAERERFRRRRDQVDDDDDEEVETAAEY